MDTTSKRNQGPLKMPLCRSNESDLGDHYTISDLGDLGLQIIHD